jgi:hypothetical protein
MRHIFYTLVFLGAVTSFSCKRKEYAVHGETDTPSAPKNRLNAPPSAGPVVPATGSGTSGTFVFHFKDPNGANEIEWAQVIFNSKLAGDHACYLHLAAAKSLYLQNDTANGLIGPISASQPGTIANGQCSIDASSLSMATNGSDLSLRVSITFAPSFKGQKIIFMRTQDLSGALDQWREQGSWAIP